MEEWRIDIMVDEAFDKVDTGFQIYFDNTEIEISQRDKVVNENLEKVLTALRQRVQEKYLLTKF